MRKILAAVLALPCLALGQGVTTYVIDTVVGGAVYNNLPATSTPLSTPIGLWMDRAGALWIADSGNQVIRRLDPTTGTLKVVVGGGTILDDAVPVPGASVQLDNPSHITEDAAGNIYFTDSGQQRVRKLTPDGQVSTIVGTGAVGFSGDGGPARLAKLNKPTGLAFDSAGNLYITDSNNCRIRRMDTSGIITTYAGSGRCDSSGDGGPALSASFPGGGTGFPSTIHGLAFDSKGNLYIATPDAVRKVDRNSGIISTVVGILTQRDCSPWAPGTPATSRALCHVVGLAFDQDDNLYFTPSFGLAKLTAATGLVSQLAGGFRSSGTGVVLAGGGKVTFASFAGFISQVDVSAAPSGAPGTLIAGSNEAYDGPARLAVLASPTGLGFDSAGRLYICDGGHGRIRRFDPATGEVTTVAGGGNQGLFDGVSASVSSFGSCFANLVIKGQGDLYFDQYNTL